MLTYYHQNEVPNMSCVCLAEDDHLVGVEIRVGKNHV
jgi:hypothetical protein